MNLHGLYDKFPSIDTSCGAVVLRTDALHNYIFNSKYHCCGGAMYRGYIERDLAYIAPYEGRYGKGVAVAFHAYYKGKSSSKFMQIYFCIEKEGEENDKI